MDATEILTLQGSEMVDGLADYVEQTAFHLITRGHGNRTPKVFGGHASAYAVGALHSDTPYGVFADMLLDLQDKVFAIVSLHTQSVVDRRNHLLAPLKRHVDDGAYHLGHFSDIRAHVCIFCIEVILFLFKNAIPKPRTPP